MEFSRTLLLKLPDKGERIRKKRQEVAEALEEVRERERNLKARDLHVDVQALGMCNLLTNRLYCIII